MPLSAGTRLGSYEVTASIGVGGMGEVYRARDTRLNRDVAIKSLPDLFADDTERVARFQREAQVLASLNHSNIAGIYGLEELEGRRFLILELVEGQSLADRLAGVRLSLDEAVAIGRQILDALEAAHEKGIVHRDVKPANIMVSADGHVKVLDFGLARVVDSDPAASNVNSPTLTFAATQMGIILGTAAYMAPEQAKGRAADKRSDVWAFGCVFYEMLTGRRVFDGEDISDTLAAVLRADPDWGALPAEVPAGVRSLLKRCLERDRKARIPDVSAVRFLLQDALSTSAAPEPAPPGVTPAASVWKRVLPAAVTGVAAAAVAVGVMWYLRPVSRQPITRFQVTLPDGVGFSSPGRRLVAFSPDGSQLVYVAGSRLNLRPMSDVEATTIRGTEALTGVSDPAFSPDGTSIAFYAGSDRSLKRISVTGGTAVTLCTIDGSPFGLTWAEDGVLFGQAGKGIMRLPTNGGSTPEVIVALKGDEMAYGPQMLPGGDRVLFTLATGLGVDRWDRARIVVQSLSSGQRTSVVEPGSDARYLPSGHLLYAVSGTVFAVGFDHRRLAATSAAVPVIEGVRRSTSAVTGAAHFALSSTGTLAYVPGPVTAEGVALDLGLADRQGNVQLLKLPPGGYVAPRVSPDGTRVAFGTDNGKEAIIYVRDVAGASAMRRLTFGGNNRYPVWSSDGTRIAYQSDRNGAPAVFWQMADGTGPAEALTTPTAGEVHSPESWSPKHDRFLFSIQKGGASSLWVYSLQQRKAVAFGDVQSVNPPNAVFSYDGKWVAYSATVQGRTTVYVQPDPPTGATYQLYAPPGNAPHEVTWSSDGTELFYNPRPSAFEAVKVTTAPTFAFGNPTIIPKQFQLGPPSSWRNYDVMPDGRFLGVFTPGSGGGVSSFPNEIRVVLNWLEDLKARVK